MAVAPINFATPQISRDLDFSSLAQLPQVYRQAQNEAIRRDTLASLGQGGQIDPMRLIQSGDMNLANLGIGVLNRQQDQQRQAAQDQLQRERYAIDDKFRAQQLGQTAAYQNRSLQLQERNADNNEDYTPEELIQRRMAQLRGAGIDPNTPRGQTYLLTGNDPQSSENNGVFGTPIYGKDQATGQMVLGAMNKDGTFRRIDTGGVQVTPGGIQALNTGAGYVPFDTRGGTITGPIIPKTGEISKDYAPSFGPGGVVTAAPIPGTPAAREIEDQAKKEAARAEQTAVGGKGVKEIIGDVRTKVTSAPWYNPAVGFGAETAQKVAGSNATDTKELITTINANIGFDRLQRMREESPTGGALGAVAVQELEALQKTIASLSQSQSKAQFLVNLKRVDDQYDRIIKKAQAYPNAAKYGFGAAPAAGNGGVVDYRTYFGN